MFVVDKTVVEDRTGSTPRWIRKEGWPVGSGRILRFRGSLSPS
jgi:hypothetical protein